MRWTVAVLLALAASPAVADPLVIPPPVKTLALPDTLETRPVQLARLTTTLKSGMRFGQTRLGLLCIGNGPLIWKGKRGDLSVEEFDDVFHDQLKVLGYDVAGMSDDLFDSDGDTRAEYLAGGTISALTVDVCYPNSGLGDPMSAKGKALMEVRWQIYDRIGRTVVARVTTRQGVEQKRTAPDGAAGIILAAFRENVRALAASGELQKYLVGERRDPILTRRPSANLAPIAMTLASKGIGTLTAAVGSTVLVQSGSGHGSGFLISRDGYFLTNQHVVGGAKFVKLRWSDGLEELGEVVRADRGRDIALVKGDPRDRLPLRILTAVPEVGTEVFAVGAPLDVKYQNSVTKGVISARRIEDGYSLIQSDVTVNPGNSGGPLINAHGDVAAVTVSSYRISGAPAGLNFFIPAHEALEFLAIHRK